MGSRKVIFLLLCLMSPSRKINGDFAHSINQALGSCDCSFSYSCCIVKNSFSGWAIITYPIVYGVWIIDIFFLVELLEMLLMCISMEGGHLLYGGHFGFKSACASIKECTYWILAYVDTFRTVDVN